MVQLLPGKLAGDSIVAVPFARVRPDQRPACSLCADPMTAGSTQGPVTYYYCECCGASKKVARDRDWSKLPEEIRRAYQG